MKKYLAILVLTSVVIPSFALASWWNPLSWSFFHGVDKTQILENRIRDLETKLQNRNAASTTDLASSTASTMTNSEVRTATPGIQKPQGVKPETPKKAPKTFILPNGAVLDEAGNIISQATNKIQDNNSKIKIGLSILSSEDIYTAVAPSVVLITNSEGAGTGFVINNGRYILTNAHVVGNDRFVKVKLQNNVVFKAVVLGKNDGVDLAVISTGMQKPPSVTLGVSDSSTLKEGSEVFALGYPLSLSAGLINMTFTKGILSSRQDIEGQSMLQIDASINSGNSGGPLLNNKGEVVGINTSKIVKTGVQGIAFAIPVDTVKKWIPILSDYGQSLFDLHPLGSTMTIPRSSLFKMELNDKLSCAELQLTFDNTCELYKTHREDFVWTVKEDMQNN